MPGVPRLHSFGKSRYRGSCDSQIITLEDVDGAGSDNGDNQIVKFSCGDGHSVLVTKNGKFYTFGNNEWGQLGNTTTSSTCTPSLIKMKKNVKIVDAFCGRNHTIVLSAEGKMYSFGAGSDNAIGHGDCENVLSPKLIDGEIENHKVMKVACGAYHSVALTAEGDVWVWGSGGESQLGNYEDECAVPVLLSMEPRIKVIDIAAGYYHSALVSEEGKLYVFGEGDAGKLGLGDSNNCEKPTRVKGIKGKVISVACGGNHTCVSTDLGHVYTFGAGHFGQLGGDTIIHAQTTVTSIPSMSGQKIVKVRCGGEFTALLNDNGEIFTCGDGHHSKLGHGPGDANVLTPKKISTLCNVMDACCGGSHLLVLARDDDRADTKQPLTVSPIPALPAPSISTTTLPPMKGRLRPLKQDQLGGSDDELVRRRRVERKPLVFTDKKETASDNDAQDPGRNALAKAANANAQLEDEESDEESDEEEEYQEQEDEGQEGQEQEGQEIFAESKPARRQNRNAPPPSTQERARKSRDDKVESNSEESESETDFESGAQNQARLLTKDDGSSRDASDEVQRSVTRRGGAPPLRDESDDDDESESEDADADDDVDARGRRTKWSRQHRQAHDVSDDDDDDAEEEEEHSQESDDRGKALKKRGKLKKSKVDPDASHKQRRRMERNSYDDSDSSDDVGCCGKKINSKPKKNKVQKKKGGKSKKGDGKQKKGAKDRDKNETTRGRGKHRKKHRKEQYDDASSTASESSSEEPPPKSDKKTNRKQHKKYYEQ